MTAMDIMFAFFLWFAAIVFVFLTIWDKSSDRDSLDFYISKYCSLCFLALIILVLMFHLGVK